MSNNIITIKDFESDIILKHTRYPDGQRTLQIYLEDLDIKKPVFICARTTSFAALEYLLCLISALRKNDFFIKKITFSYLFGMRSDRAFNMGEPNYFRDIVSPIINSLNIPSIVIYMPHSQTSLACLNNAMGEYCYYLSGVGDQIIIGGDKNTHCDANASFFKKRNGSGIQVYLSGEDIQKLETSLSECSSPILIVDDLCDAGGTFIEEAIYLKKHFDRDLILYVTHGLFTKGLDPLLAHFKHIYCTNSYQDISHPQLTQYKVI